MPIYIAFLGLNGFKFKRQQPIGNYIVDFVCFERKIIIELDGGQHAQEKQMRKDQERDTKKCISKTTGDIEF